jgi:HAD superfamily hydrolase (TIGR01509 family)
MKFAAIIFDCDGVLINSEVINLAVEREMLAELGLTYELAVYQTRFVGLANNSFFAALDADHRVHHNAPLPIDFPARVNEKCWERFRSELKAVDGVETLLGIVHVPIAVASSSGVNSLQEKLHMTGLHAAFNPHIYSGNLVANGKPAPDLFLYAAAQLEKEPAQCLVVEDSVNGVIAGVSAGMTVWGFAGGGHADPGMEERLKRAGAHQVFSSYDALGAALPLG